jgi:CheY-like chemotaxis protein
MAMPLRRGSGPIAVLSPDDDDQVRGFCRSLLTANGFTVLEAKNGLKALLTSVQHRGAIDFLLTDLEMPGISGMELGRTPRRLGWLPPSDQPLRVTRPPRAGSEKLSSPVST